MAAREAALADEPASMSDLRAALSSGDWQARGEAVTEVASLLKGKPNPDVVEEVAQHFQRLAEDRQWQVRQEVAAALEYLPHPVADELLQRLSEDLSDWVSRAARTSLRERRRLSQSDERVGQRVAKVVRRLRRLEARYSRQLVKDIEEAGLEYYQAIAFGCSHDIMNMVMAVQYSLRGLRGELERRRVPKKAWEEVLDNADRRCQIVRGISQNMRALAMQAIPPIRRVSLRAAAEEALGVVRDRFDAEEGRPRVETGLSVPRHLKVEVPRERLVQALVNLIQNAFEAIATQGTVQISGEARGDKAALTILDDGCGIADEDQHTVFFPGKSTKKGNLRTEHNTGWGLSIARKIVEDDCRGELWLESKLGAGTKMTVVLPTQRAEEVDQ
ncbi:MAG: sensor histidine kinase [Planctomycetes bacterium]|nr:sensor histidine kinase [Planctomycetota bacterium]